MADANVQAKIKLERYRSSKESGTNSVNIKADLSVNNEKRHITEKGLGVVSFFMIPDTTLNSHLWDLLNSTPLLY